jgi:hypothetical protein
MSVRSEAFVNIAVTLFVLLAYSSNCKLDDNDVSGQCHVISMWLSRSKDKIVSRSHWIVIV